MSKSNNTRVAPFLGVKNNQTPEQQDENLVKLIASIQRTPAINAAMRQALGIPLGLPGGSTAVNVIPSSVFGTNVNKPKLMAIANLSSNNFTSLLSNVPYEVILFSCSMGIELCLKIFSLAIAHIRVSKYKKKLLAALSSDPALKQLTRAVNITDVSNIKILENMVRQANVGNANLKRQLTRANNNGMNKTQKIYFQSLLVSNVLYVLTFCAIALKVMKIIKPYHNTVTNINPGQENVNNIEAFGPLLILQAYMIPGLLRGLMLLSTLILKHFKNTTNILSRRNISTNLIIPTISVGLSYFIFNINKVTIRTAFITLRDAYVKAHVPNNYKKQVKRLAQFSWGPLFGGAENIRKSMVDHSTNWIKVLSNQQARVAKTTSILTSAMAIQVLYSIVGIYKILTTKKRVRQRQQQQQQEQLAIDFSRRLAITQN